MEALLERARAYLSDLEVERHTALALSKQKAEEAKLIRARQEGFQAAMRLLGGETSATATSGMDRELATDCRGGDERETESEEPRRRGGRRPIRELIVRELSFSGQAMTAAQIASAIEYLPDRTEAALERLKNDGQVIRNDGGRCTISLSETAQINGHVTGVTNGNLAAP